MKIKLAAVVVVLLLKDIVQHIILYRRKKNAMPYANKTSNGKGEF